MEAQFELEWRMNPFSCLRQLYNAEAYSPSIKQQCKIHYLKTKLDRLLIKAYDISNASKHKQDDMQKLYSYQMHYNDQIENHSDYIPLHKHFRLKICQQSGNTHQTVDLLWDTLSIMLHNSNYMKDQRDQSTTTAIIEDNLCRGK